MKKTQKYKMVATDLDGTLLNAESGLSEYASGVLRAIEETGVKVVVCTGRSYSGSLAYLKQIGLRNPGVFCNGAQVRVCLDGEILDEIPLPIDEAKRIVRVGEETGAHPRIYLGDDLYVSHVSEEDSVYSSRINTPINAVGDLCAFLDGLEAQGPVRLPMKVINFMPDPGLLPVIMEESSRVFQDRLYITQSLSINGMIFVEYMNASATKGSGVKKVAGMYGISSDEVVVAGDHLNDMTMFKEAGFSIAPRNAHQDLLDAASTVCLSNAEDGVPKKLAEIFLG